MIKENQAIRTRYSTRYLAIKYLERDKDIERVVEALPNRDSIIAARLDEDRRIESLMHSNIESSIVDAKYAFIQGALAETFTPHIEEKPKKKLTDKVDDVVTNKWMAFPIFILLLYVMFYATLRDRKSVV